MASAEKCPVCDGSGHYRPPTRSTIQLPPQRQCHGCEGTGWVEVVGELTLEPEEGSLWQLYKRALRPSAHPLTLAMQEGLKALRAGKAPRETVRDGEARPHP